MTVFFYPVFQIRGADPDPRIRTSDPTDPDPDPDPDTALFVSDLQDGKKNFYVFLLEFKITDPVPDPDPEHCLYQHFFGPRSRLGTFSLRFQSGSTGDYVQPDQDHLYYFRIQ
jgi:hypothetical protein